MELAPTSMTESSGFLVSTNSKAAESLSFFTGFPQAVSIKSHNKNVFLNLDKKAIY